MRVHLFTTQIAKTSGGIGNTSFYMLEEIRKEYDAVVYTSNLYNDSIEVVDIIRSNGGLISTLITWLKFFKRNKKKEDISLCLSWRTALIPYLFRRHNKYIVMAHGNEVLPYSNGGLKTFLYKYIRKRILKNAYIVCSNSTYTENLVNKICKCNRNIIIHPCSGEKIVRSTMKKNNLLVSIGRLEERKGFQFVIDAIAILKDKYEDIRYYIAGDGDYKDQLVEKVKRLNLEEHCIFLGRISEEKKSQLLDECEILIMPSFLDEEHYSVEGFGIVYIEANAHGKPVIGTNSGGIPDAINNKVTGLLVEEKNSIELASAIESLLSKKIQIKEEDCIEWAKIHYYSNILKKYIEVIRSIEKEN